MYKYEECGLPNVLLQNGYRVHETPYGDAVAIEDVEGLHRAIGRRIAGKCGRLTGAEFRFLRIELDLSQKALGRMFDKSEQAVAKWEKGRTPVPQLEDATIRQLYRELLKENGDFRELLTTLVELDNRVAELEEAIFYETNGEWAACA